MLSKHTKSANLRKSGKKARKLAQKREEAISRQEIYNSLSIEEKILRAKSRRGNSSVEIARLEKQLEEVK